jgi:hypothetical protein
MNKVRM